MLVHYHLVNKHLVIPIWCKVPLLSDWEAELPSIFTTEGAYQYNV